MADQTKNNPSFFNRRITIQTTTDTPNGQGGISRTWTNLLTNIPAHIAPMSSSKTGEEKYQQHQMYATQMVIVTIRYRESTNINEKMRLLYRTKQYNIRSVYVPEEAQKTIVIYAQEIQTAGSAA